MEIQISSQFAMLCGFSIASIICVILTAWFAKNCSDTKPHLIVLIIATATAGIYCAVFAARCIYLWSGIWK